MTGLFTTNVKSILAHMLDDVAVPDLGPHERKPDTVRDISPDQDWTSLC